MVRWNGTAVAVGGAMTLLVSNVHAFAEDVCFPEDGGAVRNCSVLPAACLPVGTQTVSCRLAAAVAFVTEGARTTGVRSLVHADVTHLLAQAVGFSPTDAYWIAAYDEVVDYGVFEPTNMVGAPIGDGALRSAVLDGYVRTNIATGGMLLHFVAPYHGGTATPPTNVDGLHPDSDDGKVEVLLAHLKAWAAADGGTSRPECTAGLTLLSAQNDYATGASCYSASGSAVPIRGSIAAVASVAVPFATTTGLQTIATHDGGTSSLSTAFDSIVGGGASRVGDARLGIYLHVLADRISHHVCSDNSVISGPDDAGWNIDMTHAECAQGIHALRHMWETGVSFQQLPAAERTTTAALLAVYEALTTFASQRGVLRASATDLATRTALLAEIASALEVSEAAGRIQAIAAVACGHSLAPFPGVTACAADASAGTDGSATDGAAAAEAGPVDSSVQGADGTVSVQDASAEAAPSQTADASVITTDAASATASDSGTVGTTASDSGRAGTTASDSGTAGASDSGTAGASDSGCSCSLLPSPGPNTTSGWLAGLGAFAVWMRRRRHRRPA